MQDVFIGRQPIYDKNLKVYAYELLFRATESKNTAAFLDGDEATRQVIVNAIVEIGLDQIVGDRPAFFNMPRNFLLADNPLPFSGERLVLEVLESVEIDEKLLIAIKNLAAKGYTIALDDFILRDSTRSLVEIADIVKIDITTLHKTELENHVSELRKYPVKLLAEKVETQEEYAFCKTLDFDYYQGYFFCKPRIIKGQSFPYYKQALLRILTKLNNVNVDAEELEHEITLDITLSYRLLRTVNSAFFALPRKIDSIRQAVAYLGHQTTKNLAILVLLSGIEDKPTELIKTAMIRAKFCEKLAMAAVMPNIEIFFTVGLFSTLDALMDAPMEGLLKGLPLSEDIVDALLHGEGCPGEALSCVLAYERGDWRNARFGELFARDIALSYMEAVRWADDSVRSLGH